MKEKRISIILIALLLLSTICACGMNNEIEDDIIDITSEDISAPGFGDAVLISEQNEDVRIIPDKYNTGCKETNLEKVTGQGTYQDILIKIADNNTKLALDFGCSNLSAPSEVVLTNLDFSAYPVVCRNEHRTNKQIHVTFRNCVFGDFGSGIGESNLSYTFEDCTLTRYWGSNANFKRCKFGGTCLDGNNPYSNVTVEDCFFGDFIHVDEVARHIDGTQMYGKADVPINNIFYDNCRIEIPYVKLPGSNATVNACLMYQTEYSDSKNVHFTNCIINGGGYSIYAWSKKGFAIEDVSFENISIGEARLYGTIYPTIDEAVKFSNLLDTKQLYASSSWIDDGGYIHISVTNDTCTERTLRVYYSATEYTDFQIPACLGGKELRYYTGELSYSDFPFDIDIAVPGENKFAVCYDVTTEEPSEATQIRFVNFSDDKVYLDFFPEIVEDEDIIEEDIIEEEIIEEVFEEIVSESIDSQFDAEPVLAEMYEEPITSVFTGVCGNDVTFELNNGTLTLRGTGATDNYHSQKLPVWDERKDEITAVVIEEGITSIGQAAFARCTNLVTVSLPKSLSVIGKCVFCGCTAIEEITIPENVVYIGGYAFSGMKGLKSVYISQETYNGLTVDGVNDSFFAKLVIEEPEVVSVRETILSGQCGINVWFTIYNDGCLEITGEGKMTNYHSQKLSPWYDLRSSITCIVINGNITHIGEGAFCDCCYVNSVSIPSTVEVIGKNAFIRCASLKTVTIPASVKEIGSFAFAGTCVTDAYYDGSASMWEGVTVGRNNTVLDNIKTR